jgi:hypothetical protein
MKGLEPSERVPQGAAYANARSCNVGKPAGAFCGLLSAPERLAKAVLRVCAVGPT